MSHRPVDPPSSSKVRIPGGTAGRVAELLRQGERTVDELAVVLRLTPNAVRPHLLRLERDGVIERAGTRAGVSRPAVLYRLSAEGELRYSRAYVPVLTQLLHVLAARLTPDRFDELLRQVGRELMAGRPRSAGSLQRRAEHGSQLLNELGGLTRVAHRRGELVIRGDACPLAAATRAHAAAWNAVESLLTEFVGARVTSCCERTDGPRCCFQVAEFPAASRPA